MKLHTDPSIIEEIAYDCFWFEESSLKEALSERGIDITDSYIVMQMWEKVNQKQCMWKQFDTALLKLAKEAEKNE